MSKKVKYNIKNVFYATPSQEGTFGTPIALPGAKSVNLSAKGENEVFYADGIEYFVSTSDGGYEGDLEIALIPDEFRKDVLGEVLDSKNVLIEKSGIESKKFALGFQIDTSTGKPFLFWYYNCSASKPAVAANTSEGKKTPDTDTLTLTISPNEDGIIRARTTDATETTEIENWFKNVYTPSVIDTEATGAGE